MSIKDGKPVRKPEIGGEEGRLRFEVVEPGQRRGDKTAMAASARAGEG